MPGVLTRQEKNNMITLRKENFGGIAFNTNNAHELRLDHELFDLFANFSKNTINNNEFKKALTALCPKEKNLKKINIKKPGRDIPSINTTFNLDILNSPALIDINITENCNLHCPHCYINSKKQNGKNMSLDDFKHVLDQCKKAGVFQVALGGGEPTTHPRFTTFLKELRKNNIVPNITSNGKELSLKTLCALARYAGAVALSVEFIGPAFEKRRGFAWSEFVKSIKKLKKLKINLVFQITLSKSNLSSLNQTLNQLLKYKPYGFLFLAYKPQGRGINFDQPTSQANKLEIAKTIDLVFSTLVNKVKIGFDCCLTPMLMSHKSWPDFKGCSAGRNSLAIMPNLDVLPCSFITDKAPRDNLREKALLEIWNGKNFNAFRQKLADKKEDEKCKTCQKKEICLGGCPYFKLANCAY